MERFSFTLNDKDLIYTALKAEDADFNQRLRRSARALTDEVFGREVFLRGLVEFSNICNRNCSYCGLRAQNQNLERYRMTPEEIVDRAEFVDRCGFPTVVLQSGEDPFYSTDMLCGIVEQIKAKTGLVITLCVGELEKDDYRRLRDAGGDRYLLRHETANPELYRKLHAGHTLEQRLRCLDWIRECGYELGSGFMVGLPGQTVDDLYADLKLLVERQVDMAGIGPFVVNQDTPLNGAHDGSVEVVLNIVALLRHLLPGCNLPATTALDSLRSDGRELGLESGANVVMPIMTPPGSKEKYRLYPNKRCLTDNPEVCVGCTRRRLELGGFIASEKPGWSKQREFAAARTS